MARVYKIACLRPDELGIQRCYVGSTRIPGLTRYQQHCSFARRTTAKEGSGRGSHSLLYQHMRTYAPEDFEFSVLEIVGECTLDELRAREQHWIDRLRADGTVLYNRNKALSDPQSYTSRQYQTKLKTAREVCGCGASYCPTNRWGHRQGAPHLRWEQSQLLHLTQELLI